MDALLRRFGAPGTVFLVGAGASSRLFPNIGQSLQCMLRLSRKCGFTVDDGEDAVKDNLVVRPAKKADSLVWEVAGIPENALNVTGELAAREAANRVTASAAKAIHIACATLSYHRQDIPEYSVFRLCPPTTIATTNYDGLAAYCCRGLTHQVIHLHGLVPFRLVRDTWYAPFTEDCFIYGDGMKSSWDEVMRYRGLWLPKREQPGILQTSPYVSLQHALQRCRALVVVGYSFSGMEDLHTFEIVTEMLKGRNPSLLFVSYPTPDDTCAEYASLVSQAAKCGDTLVIKASWAALAATICDVYSEHPAHLDALSDMVAHQYYDTWERMEQDASAERKRQCRNCPLHKELLS
ncbi:MAG: hypothetical protein KKE50_07460 [Nanoarchaeota archaeon]|nr:hypothetical protein [Nanoarchaeota archaeon]